MGTHVYIWFHWMNTTSNLWMLRSSRICPRVSKFSKLLPIKNWGNSKFGTDKLQDRAGLAIPQSGWLGVYSSVPFYLLEQLLVTFLYNLLNHILNHVKFRFQRNYMSKLWILWNQLSILWFYFLGKFNMIYLDYWLWKKKARIW